MKCATVEEYRARMAGRPQLVELILGELRRERLARMRWNRLRPSPRIDPRKELVRR